MDEFEKWWKETLLPIEAEPLKGVFKDCWKASLYKEKDTGGPAFPLHFVKAFGNIEQGMTLRDYFAGMVIQASSEHVGPKEAAEYAYRVADAMLKARKGGE